MRDQVAFMAELSLIEWKTWPYSIFSVTWDAWVPSACQLNTDWLIEDVSKNKKPGLLIQMLASVFPKRLIAHPVFEKRSLRFVKFSQLQNSNSVYFLRLTITMKEGKLSHKKEFLEWYLPRWSLNARQSAVIRIFFFLRLDSQHYFKTCWNKHWILSPLPQNNN